MSQYNNYESSSRRDNNAKKPPTFWIAAAVVAIVAIIAAAVALNHKNTSSTTTTSAQGSANAQSANGKDAGKSTSNGAQTNNSSDSGTDAADANKQNGAAGETTKSNDANTGKPGNCEAPSGTTSLNTKGVDCGTAAKVVTAVASQMSNHEFASSIKAEGFACSATPIELTKGYAAKVNCANGAQTLSFERHFS